MGTIFVIAVLVMGGVAVVSAMWPGRGGYCRRGGRDDGWDGGSDGSDGCGGHHGGHGCGGGSSCGGGGCGGGSS